MRDIENDGNDNPLNLNSYSNVKQTIYTYDANGNQITKTADGKTETNTYDGLNQLIGFADGETTASYKYNASGLRYEKIVDGQRINHVWDGSKQIIADVIDNQFYEADCYIRGTNLVAKYNYRNGNKSEYTYYTQNAHGDVVNLTNADGEVTKKYTYDAFGVEKNIDENDTNAFRYCGEYFDAETGTIYLRARYYNPTTGRFISRDSFAGRRSDPLSLNLYTYCRNNPLRYVDPSGHSFISDLGNKVKEAMQKIVANTAVNKIVNAVGNAINVLTNTIASKANVDNKNHSGAPGYAPGGAPGCQHGECSYHVTADQLEQMGFNQGAVSSVRNLNIVLDKYNITSTNEISHFLAQCAYEGDWGNGLIEYDNEEKTYLKSRSYWPYYGAGYIQISTAGNYEAFSKDMNDPLIYNGEGSPEYVAANYAWEAAAWWWDTAGMNQKINEGYTVDQVSGTVIAWNKNAPDNGSYSKRRQNYEMIYDILE